MAGAAVDLRPGRLDRSFALEKEAYEGGHLKERIGTCARVEVKLQTHFVADRNCNWLEEVQVEAHS